MIMAWTNDDLLAIKAEITNDPLSLGLVANHTNDEANANALNLVRPTISVKKRTLDTADLFNAYDSVEHQALSDQQARYLGQVNDLKTIFPDRNANIVTGIKEVFGQNAVSRASVDAVMVEPGSRMRQLYQQGTLSQDATLTTSDAANALNAT
jgi:hypothetical protein